MNIYFCGSITGGRRKKAVYKELINYCMNYGEVLTKHVGSVGISGENTSRNVYTRDMYWLDNSDVVIAEVTQPSLGVGMEIEHAIRNKSGIPILCLFDMNIVKPISKMILTCPYVKLVGYSDISHAKKVIKDFIELYKKSSDLNIY